MEHLRRVPAPVTNSRRRLPGRTCAEASLTGNLGYGADEFVVRGLDTLEPAAVFGMFTYDYADSALHNREVSIEISRWGDAAKKNARYLPQPYYVAANVHRFNEPAGRLTEVTS